MQWIEGFLEFLEKKIKPRGRYQINKNNIVYAYFFAQKYMPKFEKRTYTWRLNYFLYFSSLI